jgi:hypothetical protein
MATRKTTIKPIATLAPKAAPKAAPAAPATLTIVGQPLKPYRTNSARALYWAAFNAHNGKPIATLAAHIAANPPSMPKVGKLANKAEPFSGWLSFFVTQGLITTK